MQHDTMRSEQCRRMRRRGGVVVHHLAVALIALEIALWAAYPADAQGSRGSEDRDWPCVQRLVPSLGASSFWSGPSVAAAGDWRQDPAVAALVERITPRHVAVADGEAAIAAFAKSPDRVEPDKATALTRAFAGLLELTNQERSQLIARIKDLGARQRDLANIASHAHEELSAIPVGATGEAAAKRSDLEQRFLFVTQAFESAQRTMRYACDSPVQLEARLGRYARALQSGLPDAATDPAKDATP
jgi:hypothetical protein